MLLHDPAADVQAKPHARESTIVHVRAAVEAIEHEREIFCRDTDAAIRHPDPCESAVAPHSNLDLAAGGTVRRGVFQKMLEYLPDSHGVELPDDGLAGLER